MIELKFKKSDFDQYRRGVVGVFDFQGKVLLAKRSDFLVWQFPQGGIDSGEDPVKALRREMKEELGYVNFEILKSAKIPISYNFPKELKFENKYYKGQIQNWFKLSLKDMKEIDLSKSEEFIDIKLVSPKFAYDNIVYWKKKAYFKGLRDLGYSF